MELRSACDDFLRFCAIERQLSENTLQAYACDLVDFQRSLPRGVLIADIKTDALKGYLEEALAERKLSAATIRRRFACFRAFFRRLSDLSLMEDPFSGWRLKLPRRKRLPRALSREEISRLLARLRGDVDAAYDSDAILRIAVRLMVSTGVRVGELCKLRVEDISPDGASLRVHGKGSRDRVAYIGDKGFGADLRRLVEVRRAAAGRGAPLFVNRRGQPLRPQSVRMTLRRVATQAGLTRRVTPHMLRHTAATLLIENGVDIRIVQRLLGHSSIATTEIYTHVSDGALRSALERANVLGGLVSG